MRAPPLAELYDLLRAEGFAIGVDDHVRIGRLLARDAAWTPELLHTAVAALVVTDPGERDAFDACWVRWMGGEPARTVAPVARAAPAPPAVSAEQSRAAGALRWRAMAAVAAVVAFAVVVFAVTLVLALWLTGGDRAAGRGSVSQLAGSGSSEQAASLGSSSNDQAASPGSDSSEQAVSPGFGSNQQSSDPDHGANHQQASTGSRSSQQYAGSASGSGSQPPGPASGSAEVGRQTPRSGAALGLAPVAVGVGAIILAILAIGGLREARERRRFVSGPWRYVVAVPPAVKPVLPPRAIEDAAADLTWRVPGAGRELDIVRTIAATVERGGLPTLVHRRQAAAPRYLVLEDTAGGADRWQPIYDELLSGLAREGVAIERYRFAANPERCLRPDGHAIPLGELIDHADALIVIGDGDAAVDPLDGCRAGWLTSLRQIPRRLWINPVPPVRWSAGARAIAEGTPMEHGVARAVAALHPGVERRGRPARPYPAVIERAPDTESAVAGLRAVLGDPAFHLVSAVAVTAPPTLAAARWLAEVLALGLDEQDWLAVASLPWFRTGAWPDGLRDRLAQALDAGAPDLARAVAAVADDRRAASEPPRGSAAHLAWQLEGAVRAARRGERAIADRALRRIAATPLAHPARRARSVLGLPDRAHRTRGWAVLIGTALVVAPAAYRIAAALQRPADSTARPAVDVDTTSVPVPAPVKPAPPPPPPPPPPTAKIVLETPDPEDVKVARQGVIEAVAAENTAVREAEVIAKLKGNKSLEAQIAAMTNDINRQQALLEAATKRLDTAHAAGNNAAETAAQTETADRRKLIEGKQNARSSKSADYDTFLVHAPKTGTFVPSVKPNAAVAADAVIGKIVREAIPVATFKVNTYPGVFAANASVEISIRWDEQRLTCTVADVQSDSVKVICPIDPELTEGTEVVLQPPAAAIAAPPEPPPLPSSGAAPGGAPGTASPNQPAAGAPAPSGTSPAPGGTPAEVPPVPSGTAAPASGSGDKSAN